MLFSDRLGIAVRSARPATTLSHKSANRAAIVSFVRFTDWRDQCLYGRANSFYVTMPTLPLWVLFNLACHKHIYQ